MPPLDNPRHERFCQLLCAGFSAVDAYEKAGYKRDDSAASRLSGDVRIKGRLAELQNRIVDAIAISKGWVLQQLIETFFHARSLGQISAAVGALKLLGVEAGMLTERGQIQADIAMDPAWLAMQAAILDVLSPYPDVRQQVANELARLTAEHATAE